MNAVQLAASSELAASLAKPLGPAPSALADGFHPDYPAELYHQRELGMVNSGALTRVAKSPAHYKAWIDGEDDDKATPALFLGRAIHRAILEPAEFAREYVIAPDFGNCTYKANKAARDAWRAEHKGATILDAASGAATLGMVRAVVEHPIARPLLEEGLAEMTLRWTDRETGLPCKARTDFYREDLDTAVDIKSCLDASPRAFERAILNFGYHLIEAHYRDGFEALGRPLQHYLFVAVEKTRPYALRIYRIDEPSLAAGRDQVRKARARLAESCATHAFPAYPESIETLNLPPWAIRESAAP